MKRWERVQQLGPAQSAVSGFYREHLARYEFALRYVADASVIDLGSGEGYGSALLASCARNVLGVECHPPTAQRAIRRFRAPHLRFVVGDANTPGFAAGSRDVAVSFGLLNVVGSPADHLTAIEMVLRPHGRLIVSVSNGLFEGDDPLGAPSKRSYNLAGFWDDISERFEVEAVLGQSSIGRALLTHTETYLETQRRRVDLADRAARVGGPATEDSLYFVAVCRKR